MCYSSSMPSRKQSHYRYQNENLHLLSHFGHELFTPNPQSNLGHTTKPPNTFFFFCSVRAGLVHCSWSELASPLGTRYLDWSPLISWILLKAVHLLQFVKETLLQMWAWACFVQSNTEPAQSLLESSCYKQVNAAFSRSPWAHRSHVTLGDLILKQISLCSTFIYLIWRYKDSYCSLSNL